MSALPNMPNVSQLASSLSAMGVGGGHQTSSAAACNQHVPQPAYLPTSAAPPSFSASGANGNGAASGHMSGGFQEAIGNGYGSTYTTANGAGVLATGGLGGLGMPTGGVSELSHVPMQGSSGLGNPSALPGLSSLSGNSDGGGVVLVRDLPEHFTAQELSTAFAQFGKVLFCELGEGNSGRVGYESPRDASNAVATMNGLPVGENKLLVQLAGMPY
jgi:hypothetical protein